MNKINEVDIDVKNPGLLEVPAGKEVDQLPKSHFEKLIAKKGYEKIIRGLTNLEVWNKNKNPKLSKWASNMADSLKHLQPASESLLEANAKVQAIMKGVRTAGRKSGEFLKNRSGKMVDTAQNAIVAGAVAPVGASIAQKYNHKKDDLKNKKYTSAELAAIATAMKGKSESLSSRLFNSVNILEEKINKEKKKSSTKTIAKGAAAGTIGGGTLGAKGVGALANHITGGVAGTVAPGLKGTVIRIGRGAASAVGGARGAATGLALGTVGGVAKAVHDKTHKKSPKSESLLEALAILEADKPRKKRELTPEQKARRQERRKLRRQLEKQGLHTTNRRGGGITTTEGPKSIPQSSIDNAKKAIETAKEDRAIKTPAPKLSEPPKAPEVKIPQKQPSKNVSKAQKVLKKPTTYRKAVGRAFRKGLIRGSASTAAVGLAGLAAHKYLQNKKDK